MSSGYVYIHGLAGHPRANKNGSVMEHILVAEKALGRSLKHPEEVHHFNEIKHDNQNCNLVICPDRAYHMLLHIRTEIVRAGGDPDKERVCRVCRQLKPFNRLGFDPKAYQCRENLCLECRSKTRTDHATQAGYKKRIAAETVLAIRRRREETGLSAARLGREFNISTSQALNIINGTDWKEITGGMPCSNAGHRWRSEATA